MHGRYAFLVSSLLAVAVAARGEGEGAQGGLAGWWGFDEARGATARDSSGNGNDISLTGCAGLGWNRGVAGHSLAFGRNSRGPSMRVGNRLQPARELWSVSVWIRTSHPSGTAFFVGVPHGDRWAMRVQGGRAVFEVSMGRAEGWKVSGARNVADGEWHHLVGVRTGIKRIALYVDGALQQELDTGGGTNISVGGSTFTLGSFAGEDPFVGFIDELSMHRQALTAREVRDLTASILRKRRAAPGGGAPGPGPVPVGASPGPGGPTPVPASPPETASIEEMFAAVGEAPTVPPGLAARSGTGPAGSSLDGFERLFKAGDFAGAKALAERSAGSASGDEAELFRAAARVAGLLVERDAAVRRAASETVGRDVALRLERSRVRGKVQSVTEAGITLLSSYTVNAVTRTTTRTVKWSELAPEQTEEFAAGWDAPGADADAAKALLALQREDFDQAAKLAAAAGGHPVAAYVARGIAVAKLGAAEVAAAEAWERAEKLFAAKDMKGAREAYKAFERDHGKSRTAATRAALLGERRDAIDRVLVPREITVDLGGGVTMEFVLVPAGEFSMGEEGVAEPVHKVRITKPFYLGKYEVTQAQYAKVMGENPSEFKGVGLPVEQVSWLDTQKFVALANSMGIQSGRRRHTFRLPTEGEWEYGCRAGTTTGYNTGQGEAALAKAGWYGGNSGGRTNPVGKKAPNALGLHDMHGNVSEIVQDRAGRYSADPAVDPKGPSEGWNRVHRGGSWKTEAGSCRSASRGNDNPGQRFTDHGFRCVVEPRRPAVTTPATIHWLMADNMDIYQNGKPLREYAPSFRTRRDEARMTSAFSADIVLRPGDVFTVGGRRGGSYGGTVVVVDEQGRLVWCSNTRDWQVYEPTDPERWYLPDVAMRSRQSPVRVARSFGYQARMRRDYDGIPQPIWGDPDQRFVYMVGVYGRAGAGRKPER
ncbi:MAG: SUMF1/EgtB/PvdO family nonheme iron enzyme [Planctomycetota bacterium]